MEHKPSGTGPRLDGRRQRPSLSRVDILRGFRLCGSASADAVPLILAANGHTCCDCLWPAGLAWVHLGRLSIAKYGSYRKVPPEAVDARMAWKAVLGHNRLDCRTAREVVSRAAKEYAEAGASGQWAPSTARDRE
jgi:hypothetical protein